MFMDFLDRTGVVDLGNLTAKHIHDFCLYPDNRKPITRISYLGMIRRFLKYMFSQERLERDLSSAIVTAKHYRHGGLHDVLTEADFNKLLGSLDRSNALDRVGLFSPNQKPAENWSCLFYRTFPKLSSTTSGMDVLQLRCGTFLCVTKLLLNPLSRTTTYSMS
jgi:integrase